MFRLLIPLDGSNHAEAPISFLPALKPLGDLHVLLVNVLDEADEWRTKSAEPGDREWNLRSSYLEKVAADIRKSGVSAETRILWGNPAQMLLEEAERYSPDLLAISTHGRSGLERWRMGSVADKVIRAATCNRLVIGPRTAVKVEHEIRAILVPLDGSELAEEALPIADHFARALGAHVHVMRVVSPQVVSDDMYGFSYSPELFESIVKGAEDYLSKIRDRAGAATATTVIGPPADTIIHYIESHAIDLIVMTSHGRGGIARTALGSVTDRLLGGPAPVLIVRPAATPTAEGDS